MGKENKELLKGYCPNCGTKLGWNEEDEFVTCPFCDAKTETSKVDKVEFVEETLVSDSDDLLATAIAGIDSPESAIIFLEDYFAKLDWSLWNKTATLEIPFITDMIETVKIKYGKNPVTWQLAFMGLAAPIAKKIDGFQEFKDSIINYADNYHEDVTTTLQCYSKVVKMLVDNREEYLSTLTKYIERAEQLGLKGQEVRRIQGAYRLVEKALNELHYIDKLSDIEEYSENKANLDKELLTQLAEKSVDAEYVYSMAKAAMEENPAEALSLFESIRGFRDVEELISSIDLHFSFNDELYNFCGGHFVFREEKIKTAPQLKGDTQPSYEGKAYAVYSIDENNHLSEKPVLNCITSVLATYGTLIYYVKLGAMICCYDFATKKATVLDRGVDNCYDEGLVEKIYQPKGEHGFYVRKKLKIEKKRIRCIFPRYRDVYNPNNYSLVYVDMARRTAETKIEELVDVYDCYENKVFYTVVDDKKESKKQYKLRKKKGILPDMEVLFKQYDIATGEVTQLLGDNCHIYDVFDGNVIYTVWAPNELNVDLHVLSIGNLDDKILEKNVYNYFDTVQGKVYYLVGNNNHNQVYSINLDGSGRTFVGMNISKIVSVTNDYILAIKKVGKNQVLVRIEKDADEMALIGDDLRSIVKITAHKVYYFNNDNELRSCDIDGANNVVIEDKIKNNVIIDDDAIYYIKKEETGDENEPYAYSLYKADLDGNNYRKILFNVDNVKGCGDKIYVYKEETLRFEAIPQTPKDKKRKVDQYKHSYVRRYFILDKATEEKQLVVSMGDPANIEGRKKCCLSKKIVGAYNYVLAPEVREYKRTDVATAGKNFTER